MGKAPPALMAWWSRHLEARPCQDKAQASSASKCVCASRFLFWFFVSHVRPTKQQEADFKPGFVGLQMLGLPVVRFYQLYGGRVPQLK